MPLLLPGMFWLLFVERELCLTDDDKWHKSTTRSNPITCTVSSRKRGVCVGLLEKRWTIPDFSETHCEAVNLCFTQLEPVLNQS